MLDLSQVDLSQIDPDAMISEYFSFREALYLPTWGRMGCVADGLTLEVLQRLGWFLREKIDPLRDWLGVIHTHSMWRPKAYNADPKIRGAVCSTHMALVDHKGNPLKPKDRVAAIDFHVEGFRGPKGCDKIRSRILLDLGERGLRMEDRPGSNWVHLDSGAPIPPLYHRFVKG